MQATNVNNTMSFGHHETSLEEADEIINEELKKQPKQLEQEIDIFTSDTTKNAPLKKSTMNLYSSMYAKDKLSDEG